MRSQSNAVHRPSIVIDLVIGHDEIRNHTVDQLLEKAEILVELGYHHRKGKELARRAREAGIGRGTLMQVLQRDSGQLDRLLERED